MTDDEATAVAPAYQRHLEALGLPPAVQELACLNPHDGYIMAVTHDASSSALHVHLRCGDLQRGYFDVSLSFSGVTIQPTHVARLSEAMWAAKFEILYDEIDRVAADLFEYRLLLWPVGEVAFRFKDVAISRQPLPSRLAV